MKRRSVVLTATAGAAAGALGLTVLGLPAGAAQSPSLPGVAPEQLVESVMTAAPPALSGTVQVDNALGLPALPGGGGGADVLGNGSKSAQVWTDGHGRQRLSLPSDGGEKTVVNDGSTVWKWDSKTRTVTRSHHEPGRGPERERPETDPQTTARDLVGKLRQNSEVTVDGTAKVAGRDAYELVLTPKPTERTVLREVRIAVDAEKRIPLEVVVNTHGSQDPVLKAGFTRVEMTAPDAGLFQFTPPPGAKVEERQHKGRPDHQGKPEEHGRHVKQVGDGWDSVAVSRMPVKAGQPKPGVRPEHGQPQDVRGMAEKVGKKVNGPWGEGWIVTTRAGSALLTSDGRMAVGAVPEQVLTEAIGQA
jgi:outer membrane lipoprotein-sorting protein